MSVTDLTCAAGVEIRDVQPEDAQAIASLYAWHVLNGGASFEEAPPTADEMQQRMHTIIRQKLPWLVALCHGEVLGYCYASPYRPRPAYRFTIEGSIYVANGMAGRGIGGSLMAALISRCEQGPWRQMLAIIGDGYNNPGSFQLHKKYGFEVAGELRSVGYKLGAWRDTLIMQRPLNNGDGKLPA